MDLDIKDVKALADAQEKLLVTTKELRDALTKAQGEAETARSVSTETKSALEAVTKRAEVLEATCVELQQKMSQQPEGTAAPDTLGDRFVKGDEWKHLAARKSGRAYMEVKTAIVNATGYQQPLVQDQRVPGIISLPNQLLMVRDLLPVGRTNSNLVSFAKENVFTNSAAAVYGSPAYENVTKPESGITFTLAEAAVVTLAHFIPVSKQVLDDAPMLASYINGRLTYGLKLVEEDEILNGDGTSGSISGLLNSGNYTAYTRAVTGDTYVDTVRRAITQARLSNYAPDAIVMNPADWEAIELTKGTDDHYVWGSPSMIAGPRLWGLAVVLSNSITAGTFLLGAFGMGAQIWDRQDASVQVSFEDGTNFVKNMVTVLAEERLALTVYRPTAFISGSF